MNEIILNKKYKIIDSRYYQVKAGAYGAVFKALNIQTNEIFAVKQIKRTIGEEGIHITVVRQNDILIHLKHKNIVSRIDSFIEDGKAYLVFPYFEMNVREFIVKQYQSKVPEQVVKKIMSQLLSALETAHNARFMHRDIKLENILVQRSKEDSEDFTIKLADWGSSRKFDTCINQNFTDYVIPRVYRAPELLFGSRKYSETVDIWSIGCLFYELTMGERPFQYVSPNQMLVQMQTKIGLSQIDDEKWILEMYRQNNFECFEEDLKQYRKNSLDSVFTKKSSSLLPACDLLKKMLRINPQKRISASNCLKHVYFDSKN